MNGHFNSCVREGVSIEHYMTPGVMVWDLPRSHRSVVGKLQCAFVQKITRLKVFGILDYGVMGQEIVIMDPG